MLHISHIYRLFVLLPLRTFIPSPPIYELNDLGLFFFFTFNFLSSLYVWLLMPHQMPDYSGFLCLHSAVSFVVQGLFNFTQTPINYCCYFLGSFSESPCLSHDLKVFPSSSRNSGLTVRPLTQFELISLCIDICVDLVSSLYMRETQFSTQHLLKRGSPL